MKIFLKLLLIFILVTFFIYAFSGSYISHNLENIAYTTAIGFDKGEKDNYKISFQFVNISGLNDSSSNEPADTTVIYLESSSINTAINLVSSYIGRKLSLSHCNIILFSKELAQEGISDEVYTIINNEEIRPSASIMVCDSSACDFLSNQKPNFEKLITKYYQTFEITNKNTGFIDDVSIGSFYNILSQDAISNTCIYTYVAPKSESESESESSSSSKKDNTSNSYEIFADSPANANSQRPTQNFGLAVFKKDKLISNLNEMESISHLLIKNDIDNCIFSFPCPFHENEKLDLSISPNKKTKIKVDTSSENPKVTINIYVVADLLTLNTSTTLNTPDSLDRISETAKKNLTDQIKNYLNKTCKEFDSDIDGFGKYAIKNFWTKSEWHNYDWQNKYKNCKFDVNIQLDLTSSLLLTEIN